METMFSVLLRVSATILRVFILPLVATLPNDEKPKFFISILNPVLYQLGLSHAERLQNTPPVLYGCLHIRVDKPVKMQNLDILFERVSGNVDKKFFATNQQSSTALCLRTTRKIVRKWLHSLLLKPHELYVYPFVMALDPATIATVSSRFGSVEYYISASAQFVDNVETGSDYMMGHGLSSSPETHCETQPICVVNCPTENYYGSHTEALGNWRDLLTYNILVPQRIYQGHAFVVNIVILPFQVGKFRISSASIKLIERISSCSAGSINEENDLTSDSDADSDFSSAESHIHTRAVYLYKQSFDEKFVRKCTDCRGRITIPISVECPMSGKIGKEQAGKTRLGILRSVTNKRKLGFGIRHKLEVQFRLEEVKYIDSSLDEEQSLVTLVNMIEDCMEMVGPSVMQYHCASDEQTRYDPVEMTFLAKVHILDYLAQEGMYLVPKYHTESSSGTKIPAWFQVALPPSYTAQKSPIDHTSLSSYSGDELEVS